MSRPVSFHKLEEDAYYAVLRALAVNELDWDKEKLLTDLRKVLSITNDQHFQFLEEVTEDKLVTRLREAKNLAPEPQGVAASHDMPPPRQSSNPNRKPGRPSSAGLSPSPPIGARPPRPSDGAGDLKRNRSAKRERDEVFEPRKSLGQSNSRSIKTSLLNRGRGRGKRIPGITRESMPPPTAQVITRKFKRVPFDPDHFREQLANASHEILLDMSTALALREEAIQKHSGLIQQLEDDTLCKREPLKFCQILIQELEMTEAKINSDLKALKTENEEDDDL